MHRWECTHKSTQAAQRAQRSTCTLQRNREKSASVQVRLLRPCRLVAAEDPVLQAIAYSLSCLIEQLILPKTGPVQKRDLERQNPWYHWQQAAKMPLHSLCANTAVFQARLLQLAYWEQLGSFTRVQQQPHSSLLYISPVPSASWIMFRSKPLNFFFGFKVSYQETASGRLP